MKKAIIILCALGLLSCAKEPVLPQEPAAGVPMSFEINVTETKAAKSAWADGDKIYVFFAGMETKYLVMTFDAGTDAWTDAPGAGAFLDADFSVLASKTLTAVHFPVPVDVTYAAGEFKFTSGGKPVYNYYLYETGNAYTVEGSTVTANLTMGKPADFVQLHVAGIQSTVANYTLGCAQIRPVACRSVSVEGGVNEDVLQAGARLSGIADSDGAVFAGRLDKPSATSYTFTLASNDKIYTLTRGSSLSAGMMYVFPGLSDARWSAQSVSSLYVDLGLSVKWATSNVGAAGPQNEGNHYAWGEIVPKSDYSWNTYLWAVSNSMLIKYCSNSAYGENGYTDSLTILEKEDDVAYAALGGRFRMPTRQDWTELGNTKKNSNYTWTWCDGTNVKYNGTSAQGLKIVRNSTNATLFLPAAGLIGGMMLVYNNANPFSSERRAFYWSSSLNTDNSRYSTMCEFFYSSTAGQKVQYILEKDDFGSRYYGYSVRPVYD